MTSRKTTTSFDIIFSQKHEIGSEASDEGRVYTGDGGESVGVNEDLGDNCIRARGVGMYLLDPGSETKKF